jgi:hypothetical protein
MDIFAVVQNITARFDEGVRVGFVCVWMHALCTE